MNEFAYKIFELGVIINAYRHSGEIMSNKLEMQILEKFLQHSMFGETKIIHHLIIFMDIYNIRGTNIFALLYRNMILFSG